MRIISCSEAKASGQKRYFTGDPCIRGHIAERQTSNGSCMVCCNEKAKAAYAQNPSKFIAKRMASYQASTEIQRLEMKNYYAANSESQRIKGAARYWRDPDARRKKSSQWALENPAKKKAQHILRRANKLNATPIWFGEFDEFVAKEAAELCQHRESATGFEWHVDHMIPMRCKTVCGLHVGENLQVIPAGINISKRNKLIFTEPFEWLT